MKCFLSMKRLSIIILLSALSCTAICQPFTLNVGGTLITRYNYTSDAYVRIED